MFRLKVQENILEVLGNAQRQHQLPLIFLFASRPEQHISLAFSTGILPNITTRITLDETYLPDEDIRLFLTDKFMGMRSTHRLRAYIPPQWPLPNVLNRLVRNSSGEFIYASTVIHFVSSIRHKPTDRLDIVLAIRPPQKDLPFAELDAYTVARITRGENEQVASVEVGNRFGMKIGYEDLAFPCVPLKNRPTFEENFRGYVSGADYIVLIVNPLR